MTSTYLLFLSFLLVSYASADPLGNDCGTVLVSAKANINQLLSQILAKTRQTHFAAISYGQGQTKLYGLAQCREDVSSTDCFSCVQNATQEIRSLCPSQADARIWYDFCFLRYSNQDFIGELDASNGILYRNAESVTDPGSFNKALGAIFAKIDSTAVKPGNKGLGKGATKLSPLQTLYALVQCTGDLSQLSCSQCLATAKDNFQGFCSNSKGCRVLYGSCYVRYELYPFYFPLVSRTAQTNTIRKLVRP